MINNKWKFLSIVLLVISVSLLLMILRPLAPSPEKIASQAIKYINDNLLVEGLEATLDKVEDEKIALVYKMKMEIGGQSLYAFVDSTGKYLFVNEPVNMSEPVEKAETPEMLQKESTDMEGGFKEISEVEVCLEEDKPIFYFFGSESCPHCTWEKPIADKIAEEFKDYISYHKNFDGQTEGDVLLKYGSGSVPALILGCKYYRIGSGEAIGEEKEEEILRDIMCKMTNNLPASSCN